MHILLFLPKKKKYDTGQPNSSQGQPSEGIVLLNWAVEMLFGGCSDEATTERGLRCFMTATGCLIAISGICKKVDRRRGDRQIL